MLIEGYYRYFDNLDIENLKKATKDLRYDTETLLQVYELLNEKIKEKLEEYKKEMGKKYNIADNLENKEAYNRREELKEKWPNLSDEEKDEYFKLNQKHIKCEDTEKEIDELSSNIDFFGKQQEDIEKVIEFLDGFIG